MTKKHEKVLRRKKVNCQVGYNTVPSGETISGLIHHTNPESNENKITIFSKKPNSKRFRITWIHRIN